MMIQRITASSLAGAGLLVASVLGAGHAAAQDGVSNDDEFIFYYNSGLAGSLSDFSAAKADLAGFTFVSSGSGQGQFLKKNAASVDNRRAVDARVYFNSNYAGAYDHVNADSSRNLVNTYNNNASFRWQ